MATIDMAAAKKRLRGRRPRQPAQGIIIAHDKLLDAVSSSAESVHIELDLELFVVVCEDAVVAAAMLLTFRHGQRALVMMVVRQMEVG